MNCDDCVDRIARRLDGSLSQDEERALAGHLAECPACRAELLLQQGIAESLRAAPAPALASDFTRRVTSRAFAEDRYRARARRWGYFIPVAAFAVVVLVAAAYRAEIAGALAPVVAAVGGTMGAAARWIGVAAGRVSSPATPQPVAARALAIWGPLACAAVIVMLASSRIYALRRR